MDEKEKKNARKLTDRAVTSDNQATSRIGPAEHDPRIIALVQYLARRAAERDFAQLIEKSRADQNPSRDKGRIQ